MQVFKAFFKILWTKRGSIFLYTGIFMGLAIGMASMGGKSVDSSFVQEKYEVAIFDYDQSELSGKFVDYLSDKTNPVEKEDDVEKLRDQLFIRNIAAVIYVKEGYEEQLQKGNVEDLIEVTTLPGSIYNQNILNYIDQYMSTLHGYLEADMELQDAVAKTGEIMNKETEVIFSNKKAASGKSQVYYYMLYIPYVFISCSFLAIGNCIMVFHNREVKNRMNISSSSLVKRNAGLWGGCVLAELILVAFFVLVAIVMYRDAMFTVSSFYFVLNVLCNMAVCLGMTFFIGILAKSETILSMVSNVVGLGCSFLGGMFVPLDIMSEGVKVVSHFIPTYWYVQALEVVEGGNMSQNAGEYWMALGIQLAFAAAFTAVGLGITKMRQRES